MLKRVWNFLQYVLQPIGKFDSVVSKVAQLLAIAGIIFALPAVADWSFATRLWLLVLLFAIAAWRLFSEAHPTFDVRIEAPNIPNVQNVTVGNEPFYLVTIPGVRINPHTTGLVQLEFELRGSNWTLGSHPFDRLKRDPKFAGYMDNPKALERSGLFIRDLGFARYINQGQPRSMTTLSFAFATPLRVMAFGRRCLFRARSTLEVKGGRFDPPNQKPPGPDGSWGFHVGRDASAVGGRVT